MSKSKYFGEFYPFTEGNDQEKEEAIKFLSLWKKNLLYKLSRDSFHCEVVDEHMGERPAYLNGAINQKAHMYLKLCLEAKWEYELK